MAKIAKIKGFEILDSRGNPTIQTFITMDNGIVATAAVPSGASVGTHEAAELRDNDPKRYHGMGVLKAIENIEKIISPKLCGMDPQNQKGIDDALIELDGTENKSKLGANAILGVSMAVAKASAKTQFLPLYSYIKNLSSGEKEKIPAPLFNILNGGKHAGENVDFQEFIICPDIDGSFSQKLEVGVLVYSELKKILHEKGLSVAVGDEGGFAPNLSGNQDALALIKQAITDCGFNYKTDIRMGLDAAANTFFNDGKYKIKEKSEPLTTDEIIKYYSDLQNEFNFLYLEDLLSEDDWDGWEKLCVTLPSEAIVTGDDLVVTNPNRLKTAIEKKAIRGVIIKLNQIGTVTETLEVLKMAKNASIKTIISHRSGETNDDFIADFAVGVASDFVKFGAPVRGERVAKYNRLLEIESELL